MALNVELGREEGIGSVCRRLRCKGAVEGEIFEGEEQGAKMYRFVVLVIIN